MPEKWEQGTLFLMDPARSQITLCYCTPGQLEQLILAVMLQTFLNKWLLLEVIAPLGLHVFLGMLWNEASWEVSFNFNSHWSEQKQKKSKWFNPSWKGSPKSSNNTLHLFLSVTGIYLHMIYMYFMYCMLTRLSILDLQLIYGATQLEILEQL